jgi:hypothetical protein
MSRKLSSDDQTFRGIVIDSACTGASVVSAIEYKRYCRDTGAEYSIDPNSCGYVRFGDADVDGTKGRLKSLGTAKIRGYDPESDELFEFYWLVIPGIDAPMFMSLQDLRGLGFELRTGTNTLDKGPRVPETQRIPMRTVSLKFRSRRPMCNQVAIRVHSPFLRTWSSKNSIDRMDMLALTRSSRLLKWPDMRIYRRAHEKNLPTLCADAIRANTQQQNLDVFPSHLIGKVLVSIISSKLTLCIFLMPPLCMLLTLLQVSTQRVLPKDYSILQVERFGTPSKPAGSMFTWDRRTFYKWIGVQTSTPTSSKLVAPC